MVSDWYLNWWGYGLLASPKVRPEEDACDAFAEAVEPFRSAFGPKNEKKFN